MKRSPKAEAPGSRGRHLVFLSHASKDQWVARQLESHLRQADADVFLDALAIEAGGNVDESIRRALGTMDELVVLLTPWSLKRPYVWWELGVAYQRRVPIMGLLYGLTMADIQKTLEIPNYVKATNLKDLNDVDVYLEALRKKTRRLSKP